MMALRERLQATLAAAYSIDRELGGGGMSQVFVAHDARLDRDVVVKVLAPHLAEGVNAERFQREIQLAASLQQANIVPVLSAGETDGLPFYIMPFVDGESLRARLATHGALPIADAVSVLRDVARALAYAHGRGVVHRDIKPDNVLLSGGTAVVTDFGIAKAIADSRATPTDTLTQLGTSLGTPAYMAPEQVAGDPDIDHRADIYSFGCMAYELLTNHTPFADRPARRVMAAHLSDAPTPVREVRAEIPAPLAHLVMRCLEKDPAARPQSAAEVVSALEAATSGATLVPTRATLTYAMSIYVVAFLVVAGGAKLAITGIGLPDWVFPAALATMGLGLPAILVTAFITPSASFRRVAIGGVAALGAFVAGVGTFMLLRALGVGPAGSLIAAGKMATRERVILTEFKGPPADSTLGPTVSEALRTDIAQSSNLSIMPASSVHDVLLRMQRASAHVDFAVAREVATREGVNAILDGEIVSLGGGYVLSARLVDAASGSELAVFRETAADAKQLIPAIDHLTKRIRSKVGESLRAVQNAPRLEAVTTPSLEALRKYVAGVSVIDAGGDVQRGMGLLEEAISLDSGFAMAYRALAVTLNNRGLQFERQRDLVSKAYAHRDRLTDMERGLTDAAYYEFGPERDFKKAASAYEAVLQIDPENLTALNNLSIQYSADRNFPKAEELLTRALAVQRTVSIVYQNLIGVQMDQGHLSDAEKTLALFTKNLPQSPATATFRGQLALARGNFDLPIAIAESLRKARPNDPAVQAAQAGRLAGLMLALGRLKEGLAWRAEVRARNLRAGNRQAALNLALDEPEIDVQFREKKSRALEGIARALREQPLDSIPAAVRPYERLALLYAEVDRPDLAKPMVELTMKQRIGADQSQAELSRHNMAGEIAIAEHRYDDAVREFRATDVGSCVPCALPDIARAYDLAGNADSALAIFARYVAFPNRVLSADQTSLAGAHKRLGELFEARGNTTRAASEYAAFLELWKNADPDLQPLVTEVRKRLERLGATEPAPSKTLRP